MQTNTTVLIIGAGPTGLTAAYCLRRHGIDCLIIDELAQASTTSNAAGVQARTLELWNEFGIVDQAFELGNKIEQVCAYAGEKQLFRIDFSHIDSPYQCVLLLPQYQTEHLMRTALQKEGLEVLRSHKLTALQQNDDGVTATIADADGAAHTVTADYVIGADGYHSTTRECVGIPFKKTDFDGHFMMMDAPVVKPESLNHQITLAFDPSGLLAIFPMQEYARVIIECSHDPELKSATEPTFDIFKQATERRYYQPVEYGDLVWQTAFYIHEGIVDRYREGRVFLAGDAAHVHSPAGGQGMNLGIQDADCLANTLAAVLSGANETTLNSYQDTRRPIAEKVIKMSSRMLKGANLKNPILVGIRNKVLPLITANANINNQMASTLAMLEH